jgi:hypothetical protein
MLSLLLLFFDQKKTAPVKGRVFPRGTTLIGLLREASSVNPLISHNGETRLGLLGKAFQLAALGMYFTAIANRFAPPTGSLFGRLQLLFPSSPFPIKIQFLAKLYYRFFAVSIVKYTFGIGYPQKRLYSKVRVDVVYSIVKKIMPSGAW